LLVGSDGARPSLVFAEAELLSTPGINPKLVSELIIELENTSDPIKQVRARATRDTLELRLTIHRNSELR
jgi:hypothetical protein